MNLMRASVQAPLTLVKNRAISTADLGEHRMPPSK
jgi:hypothetical protein